MTKILNIITTGPQLIRDGYVLQYFTKEEIKSIKPSLRNIKRVLNNREWFKYMNPTLFDGENSWEFALYPDKGQGYIYGFGLSQKVYNLNKHNFYLSLDFRFYSKKGKSTYTDEDTKLTLRPVSLAGAYFFFTKNIIPFAEVGVDYYSYQGSRMLFNWLCCWLRRP